MTMINQFPTRDHELADANPTLMNQQRDRGGFEDEGTEAHGLRDPFEAYRQSEHYHKHMLRDSLAMLEGVAVGKGGGQ
jgi:hypothetical protein